MNDEDGFIQAIRANPGDGALRLVYADWLEERGDPRAEYLRLDAALAAEPDDPAASEAEKLRRLQLRERFRTLSETLKGTWVVLVARSGIENCSVPPRPDCPRSWDRLNATAADTIRRCESCGRNVYYCTSLEQARQEVHRSWCVAVDARVARSPDDLRLPAYVTTYVGRGGPVPAEQRSRRQADNPPARTATEAEDEHPPGWRAEVAQRRRRYGRRLRKRDS